MLRTEPTRKENHILTGRVFAALHKEQSLGLTFALLSRILSGRAAQCKQWFQSFSLSCNRKHFPSFPVRLALIRSVSQACTLHFLFPRGGWGLWCHIGSCGSALGLSRLLDSDRAGSQGQTAAPPLPPAAVTQCLGAELCRVRAAAESSPWAAQRGTGQARSNNPPEGRKAFGMRDECPWLWVAPMDWLCNFRQQEVLHRQSLGSQNWSYVKKTKILVS